jgi:hypothetical protein
MARETGLEPAASAVTGRRSNQLSYSRNPTDSSFRRVSCFSCYGSAWGPSITFSPNLLVGALFMSVQRVC